jgi:hypothetical protein
MATCRWTSAIKHADFPFLGCSIARVQTCPVDLSTLQATAAAAAAVGCPTSALAPPRHVRRLSVASNDSDASLIREIFDARSGEAIKTEWDTVTDTLTRQHLITLRNTWQRPAHSSEVHAAPLQLPEAARLPPRMSAPKQLGQRFTGGSNGVDSCLPTNDL